MDSDRWRPVDINLWFLMLADFNVDLDKCNKTESAWSNYLDFSMLSPSYASLLVVIVITSQHALGSCQLRSCIKLGRTVLRYNINRLNPGGYKGIMTNNIIQSVSINAPSALSISSDSETSSLTRSFLSSNLYLKWQIYDWAIFSETLKFEAKFWCQKFAVKT